MNDSSSSSSSDGLSFILHDSSDEERILKYVFDNDNDKRALEVITKLTQVTQETMASSSSRGRRLRKKKGSLRETAKKHTNVCSRIISLKTPSTTIHTSAVDLGCGDTSSFAQYTVYRVGLSSSSRGAMLWEGVGCHLSPNARRPFGY